jgi:hypothetical protein
MKRKVVPGVAFLGLAAASMGAGPAPIVVWPVPAKLAPFVLPAPPSTKILPLRVAPSAVSKPGAQLIPIQITGHAELIPTNWPEVKIVLLDR